MDIRVVTVELLRVGPRHNQLLSPLTPYLGVCGNAAVDTVKLPYEQRDFDERLQELRYEVVAEDDPARLARALDKTGREMACILRQVQALSGALNAEIERSQTLTQLRIVFSASELAMLPFELSKLLSDPESSGVWLALQARNPVCITRHVRSVSAEGTSWPTNPRILFIAGPETPADEHREALLRVMAPWLDADGSPGDRLVVLQDATRAGIKRAVADAAAEGAPFTQVHILAHGAPLRPDDRYSTFGVELRGEVISGQQLAIALTSMGEKTSNRPAVVTLATCDSAKEGDVRMPDASVAHDLHDQGIPLVVASQFPLSVEGSLPFVEIFFGGQLWGKHPLVSIHELRQQLFANLGHKVHDWAALVVYEAFPSDFKAQLEQTRYWQTRRAQDRALIRLEALVTQGLGVRSLQDSYATLVKDADAVGARLPDDGPYALECAGLRAAGHKRIAQVAFELAGAAGISETWRNALYAEFLRRLDESRAGYWRATKSFLGPTSEPIRRKANLHWLLGQVLSLDVVMGRRLSMDNWTAAHLAARIDTESPDEVVRAWAHVSLSELALLRLADAAVPSGERTAFAQEAIEHATVVVELLGRGSEHVMTTSRQFERYIDCWGNRDCESAFARLGIPGREHWHDQDGLVPTAVRVVQLLSGSRPPASPSAQSGGGDGTPRSSSPPKLDQGTATTVTKPATTPPSGTKRATTLATPVRRLARSGSGVMFDIEMLPAENGDCLWIEYGDPKKPRRVLIDCGAESTARVLASRFAGGSPRSFELFVLTHIDADHINGVLPLFGNRALNARFEDIWFNGWRQVSTFLSVRQAEDFSRLLEDPKRGLPWNLAMSSKRAKVPAPIVIAAGKPLPSFDLPGGMRLTLLSPGASQLSTLGRQWKIALQELKPPKKMLGRKAPPPPVTDFDAFDVEALAKTPARKDPSVPNGSCIGLLAEFDGRSILLTGDAYADVLATSIKALQRERGHPDDKLKLDALKLSHHGSANATTSELLNLLDCPRYLVSTNGNIFYHPDREAIARVIVHGGDQPTLLFNYRSPYNGLWDEPSLRKRCRYQTVYPKEGKDGLRVSL
jgi:hypothetical protein